jgi:hypothetical protein
MLSTDIKGVISDLQDFYNNSQTRMDWVAKWENLRNYLTILSFLLYVLFAIFALLGYYKRWPYTLLFLSIVIAFTIPVLVSMEGFLASYYFIYTDLCVDVHGAIYQNKFPITDTGLGYYTSCFNAQTKSRLYSSRYEIEEMISKKIEDPEKEKSANIFKEYLDRAIKCDNVYSNVVNLEEQFCKNGLSWSKNLLASVPWLVIVVLIFAYAVNRLKPLVEKRKSEIDVKYF